MRALSQAPTLLAALLLASCAAAPNEAVVSLPRAATDPPTLVEKTSTTEPTAAPAQKLTAIPWQLTETRARALAKSRNVALVVFLFADWSPPAVSMDRVTWGDARVLDRAGSFVALRLDVSDTSGQAQADADRFDLGMLPSTLIFDADGTEVGRVEGFATAEDVVTVLDSLAPRAD